MKGLGKPEILFPCNQFRRLFAIKNVRMTSWLQVQNFDVTCKFVASQVPVDTSGPMCLQRGMLMQFGPGACRQVDPPSHCMHILLLEMYAVLDFEHVVHLGC